MSELKFEGTEKRIVLGIIGGLAILALLIGSLGLCIFSAAYDLDFYKEEYQKLERAEATGMSEDDLMRVTEELVRYLKGERMDLNMEAEVHGEMREVFNDKEKEHMADVQMLFELLNMLVFVGLIAAVVFIGAAVFMAKKLTSEILLGGFIGALATLGVIGVLAILFSIDFTGAFTVFHEVFFANDLWILNPSTDILIQMVPQTFFVDIALHIVVRFAAVLGIVLILTFAGWRLVLSKEQQSGA